MTTTNDQILKELKEMGKTQVDTRLDIVEIRKDSEHTREIVDDINANDKVQNGALAEVVRDHAVLAGKFSMQWKIVAAVATPMLIAAVAELSGYIS